MKRLDGIYKKIHVHDQYYWWGGECSKCGKKRKNNFSLMEYYKEGNDGR